jgi:hypothetical protein
VTTLGDTRPGDISWGIVHALDALKLPVLDPEDPKLIRFHAAQWLARWGVAP